MKKLLFTTILSLGLLAGRTQQIDSIEFHLYTDSLKKGTNNYINVDGKTNDGRWLPMTPKEIRLTSSFGSFQGNDLVLPWDFREAFVVVTAELKANPGRTIERKIWVKQQPDPELPAEEPVKGPGGRRRRG